MHPKNPYFNKAIFGTFNLPVLYEQYPEIRQFTTKDDVGEELVLKFDFKKEGALMVLTQTLLKHDFGLLWSIPKGTLCPTIPNRCNYLCWLKWDLVVADEGDNGCVCLDVGTGASCIYPLLGCRMFSKWRFVGTDISKGSVEIARENVSRNELDDRISIIEVPPCENGRYSIFEYVFTRSHVKVFDVTMCNPPFYGNAEEMQGLRELKGEAPYAASTGDLNELFTEGGEEQFLDQMIQESLKHWQKSRWFTSMMGKRSTFQFVEDKLSGLDQVTRIQSTVLVQGSTRRWVIAWSFIPNIQTAFDTISNKKRKRQEQTGHIKKSFTYRESIRDLYLYLKNDLKLDVSEEIDGSIIVTDISTMTWLKDHMIKGKPAKSCLPFSVAINSGQSDKFECIITLLDAFDSQRKGLFNSFVTHLIRRQVKK